MIKHHITLNPSVYKKLDEIFCYLNLESPQIAITILTAIETSIMSLEFMPERFSLVPEKITYKNYKVRHLFCKKSFRIIYTIVEDEVKILDVRHAAQNKINGL